MKDRYYCLARMIKQAGKEISRDHINKIYSVSHSLGFNDGPVLEVTDDSGYRSIVIGYVSGDRGYAYLYSENADEKGKYRYSCYPSILEIREELIKVLNGAEGYYGNQKTPKYLAAAVEKFAVAAQGREGVL